MNPCGSTGSTFTIVESNSDNSKELIVIVDSFESGYQRVTNLCMLFLCCSHRWRQACRSPSRRPSQQGQLRAGSPCRRRPPSPPGPSRGPPESCRLLRARRLALRARVTSCRHRQAPRLARRPCRPRRDPHPASASCPHRLGRRPASCSLRPQEVRIFTFTVVCVKHYQLSGRDTHLVFRLETCNHYCYYF